jgi:hypothetical protein
MELWRPKQPCFQVPMLQRLHLRCKANTIYPLSKAFRMMLLQPHSWVLKLMSLPSKCQLEGLNQLRSPKEERRVFPLCSQIWLIPQLPHPWCREQRQVIPPPVPRFAMGHLFQDPHRFTQSPAWPLMPLQHRFWSLEPHQP